VILRELSLLDQFVFERSLNEWDDFPGFSIAYEFFKERNFQDYLNFLQSFAHESIPTKVFFAFHDDKIIGKVNIRHKLNPQFESTDGHIGYGVNPAYRGLGYGTQMLQLSLEICRDLGLEKVLLICDEANIASIKVIVKNGGILEESLDQSRGKKKRFWIKIS
jgi:predicted acetyltransferase